VISVSLHSLGTEGTLPSFSWYLLIVSCFHRRIHPISFPSSPPNKEIRPPDICFSLYRSSRATIECNRKGLRMFSHCRVAKVVSLLPLTANTHVRFEILVGFVADRAVRHSHVVIIPQMLHTFESFLSKNLVFCLCESQTPS